MDLLPLILSVKRSRFRRDDPEREHADREFLLLRPTVLKRDNYTCRYCGMRAEKFQEVHHRDDNHQNNDLNNLVTICALCHSSQHLYLSGHMDKGVLVHIPQLSQAELNALSSLLFYLQDTTKEASLSQLGHSIYKYLYQRKIQAREMLGTDNPKSLGAFLIALNDDEYSHRHEKLTNIRLLPTKKAFQDQISYWNKHVFDKNIPSTQWLEYTQRIYKQLVF